MAMGQWQRPTKDVYGRTTDFPTANVAFANLRGGGRAGRGKSGIWRTRGNKVGREHVTGTRGHGTRGKNAILMLVLLFYVVARVAGKNEDARDVVHSRNKKRTRSYGLTE